MLEETATVSFKWFLIITVCSLLKSDHISKEFVNGFLKLHRKQRIAH